MKTLILALLTIPILAGCNGPVLERLTDESPTPEPIVVPNTAPSDSSSQTAPALGSARSVTVQASINGYALAADDLAAIEAHYGLYIESGDYWYDPISGAWGYLGGPTVGFLQPYMELGYPPANASGGGTGVAVNGRELHPADVAGLQQLLGPIYPGYYWLDASGNYGVEGGPALGNLIYAAQGAGGGGGYHDSTYAGYIGSDGQSSYFYDPSTGCSVMSGGGVSC